jgi:N-acetylglucosaminyl-diphospho-decaprenol L-rhamnosyltransferase
MGVSVDVIIVNWNSGHCLRQCLESIVMCKKNEWELRRVVVVDNASNDHSADALETLDLPLLLINNLFNRGFAAACNQGARESKGDYLLFLNPDTILFENTLGESIAFLTDPGHAMVGICGVRLVNEAGSPMTSCARFPTLKILFGKMTGLSHLLPGLFPPHLMGPEECIRSREVEQVIGAYFLVRRELFEGLNGFDERFFVYFEEVDFSFRARKKGYSSYFLADTSLYHRGGGSSEQVRSKRLYYSLRSRILYGYKHFSHLEAMTLLVLTLTLELATRLVWGILTFSSSRLKETLGGYAYFMRSILTRNLP